MRRNTAAPAAVVVVGNRTSSSVLCTRSSALTFSPALGFGLIGPSPSVFALHALVLSRRGWKYSPYESLRKRPTKSPAERRRDEQIIFPKTLKSGRYENEQTVSQKLFRGPTDEQSSSSSAASPSSPDRRFFRPVQDYREIQDNDPYASVFGERESVKNVRVKQWQRQFEDENADVELPYERTSWLRRTAPNFFVRFFVNLRDGGGVDHVWPLLLVFAVIFSIALLANYLLFTAPSRARPLSEVR